MKKLIMMAAVAACAIQVQAASTWTATIDFGTDYSDYSVWTVSAWNDGRASLFPTVTAPSTGYTTGTDYAKELNKTDDPATQISILNGTVTDYNTCKGAYSVLKDLKVGTDGKVTISTSAGEQYSWLFVLASGLDANGKATYGTKYAVIQAHEHERTDAEILANTGGVDYGVGGISDATYHTGNYTISGDEITVLTSGTIAIPEPTSGLLLLLGMAGLCLRRKQK